MKAPQTVSGIISSGRYGNIERIIHNTLKKGTDPSCVLEEIILPSMAEAVNRFVDGSIKLPDLLLSVKTMRKGIKVLEKSSGKDISQKSMVTGTIGSLKYDPGKYLVGIIAESMGLKIIDVGNADSFNNLKGRVACNRPLLICLSGPSLKVSSEQPCFKDIFDMPGYRDKASFIVFSPPVTTNMSDRLGVTFYTDLSDKTAKEFLKVLEKLFYKLKA